MRFYLMIFFALILASGISAQPSAKITCRLLSADNRAPIEGASISYQNGKIVSIVADKNGLFHWEGPSGTVLSISHAEFLSIALLVDTVTKNPQDIYMLPDNKRLENITINTGYEKIELHQATGSFVQINNELLNRSQATSLLERLDGITTSLYFDNRKGTDAPIQIRGVGTFGYAPTEPLIVLDNFPYEGNLDDINPNNIESVTILRDAAATAIWGAKAGNGVIVINTKKGSANKPLSLTVNANKSIRTKPDLFSIDRISTSDYIDVEKFLFEKGFYDSRLNNPRDYSPFTPVVYILADQRSGKITENEADEKINYLKDIDVRHDFEKYVYQAAITNSLGVSLAGGAGQAVYYFGANADESKAGLEGNSGNRVNIFSKTSFRPLKTLTIDGEISYTARNSIVKNQIGYGDLITKSGTELYPYAQLADESGNPLVIEKNYRISFLDTLGGGRLLDWKYRPLDELNHIHLASKSNSLIVNAGLRYEFAPFLNLEVKYQFQQDETFNNSVYDVGSFNTRTLINQYTTITGDDIRYGVPVGDIVDKGNSQNVTHNIRGQINFRKDLNKDVNLAILAGGEVRSSDYIFHQFRIYGADKNLNRTGVNSIDRSSTLYGLFGSGYISDGISIKETSLRFLSGYSTASFSYKKIYILSSSIRYDASNLFGVRTNKKGVPLWSLGLAVNISDYKNYNIDWLPFLKFRSTIGYGGNLSPESSALTTIRHSPASNQAITGIPFASVVNYPNPDLGWEKVRTVNMGIDFAIFDRRIGGSFDYYFKRSTDVIGPKAMDPTYGLSSINTNSGQLNGKGFELTLFAKNVYKKDFDWTSTLLLSFNKSTIKKYLGTSYTTGLLNDGLYILRLEGFEPFAMISYAWAGLDDQGNPQGMLDGKRSIDYNSLTYLPLDNQVVSGSAIPHYFGSLRNDFRYKSIQLSFNLKLKAGYFFRKPALSYNDLFKSGKGISEFQNRWQKPGDELNTSVPSMVYPVVSARDQFYIYSDANVLNGSSLRLDDIRLSYLFRNGIGKQNPIKSAEVFAIASSLNAVLWRKNQAGIDPEYPSGLKPSYNFSLGLNLNF